MMIDGYVAEILNNQIIKDINAKKATDKEFADYFHVHSVPINLVNNAVLKTLEEVRAEIEEQIERYDDRNISEYEDCLAIIDRKIAEVTKNEK